MGQINRDVLVTEVWESEDRGLGFIVTTGGIVLYGQLSSHSYILFTLKKALSKFTEIEVLLLHLYAAMPLNFLFKAKKTVQRQ